MSAWAALAEGDAVGDSQWLDLPVDEDKIRLSGQLFYNDLRKQGSFNRRYDANGVLGERCPYGNEDCDLKNYLAAMDASVEIVSLDPSFGCSNPMAVGSIRPNAKFEFYFSPDMDCLSSSDLSLGIRFLLRRCDDIFCGAMEATNQETWALWHPEARPEKPLTVSLGEGFGLAGALFQPYGVSDGESDLYATAANHFATLIDAVQSWHVDAGIPFEGERYGEVRVRMPAGYETRGGTQSTTEVHLPDRDSGWIKGNLAAHEYGHVLQLRAWGGAYDWDGPTHPEWSGMSQAHPRIAFKEGFANFVMRVGLETNHCDGGFDDNDNSLLAGDPETGQDYPRNVTKFLCDWLDETDDDDLSLIGHGDSISSSPFEVWSELVRMKSAPEAYGGDTDEGLGVCDFISSHLAHIDDPIQLMLEESAIKAAARNNKIDCGWP